MDVTRRRELDNSDVRRAEDAAADAVQHSKAAGRSAASKRRAAPVKKNSAQQVEKKADVEHVAVELGKVAIADQSGKQKVDKTAAAGRKRLSKKTASLVKGDNSIDTFSPVSGLWGCFLIRHAAFHFIRSRRHLPSSDHVQLRPNLRSRLSKPQHRLSRHQSLHYLPSRRRHRD